jgi:putative inorganic carbon (HCO3(-)) transporter
MGVRAASFALSALVVGSVVVVDPSGLAPFGPAKWLTIGTLGALGGGLALWSGRRPLHRPTLLVWAGLIALLALGALLGDDVPTSLLGHPDRHLGLITWLLFLLLYCAGQQLGDDDRRRLARAAVVATLVLGAWAVWERVVGTPIDIDATTSRLTGPFGSAAYLGAAACLLVPISAGVALDRTTARWWRAAAGLATGLGTFALIGSGARAAWSAAVVALAVVFVVARPQRRVIVAGAAVAIAAIALSAPRLGDVADRSDGAGSRFDEWAVAVRVIGDHPLVGVGPEGYRMAVSEQIDRHYERTYGRDRVLPDRAHSGPLDVALDGGVLAALASLALVGFVCWRALRLVRGTDAVLVGIGVGVIA